MKKTKKAHLNGGSPGKRASRLGQRGDPRADQATSAAAKPPERWAQEALELQAARSLVEFVRELERDMQRQYEERKWDEVQRLAGLAGQPPPRLVDVGGEETASLKVAQP